MQGIREGRHLAAIMFMDMVGYSARMQESEADAIAAVRALWDLVRPILAEHGGREVDLAGDGMLMEFPGALNAVRCALQVQSALHARNKSAAEADRIKTRAGVHLGDVEHRDGRIYGDGVNIAARLLPLAPPGAIALSRHVRDQLRNVLDRAPDLLGTRVLKNIREPMEIWCLPGPDCAKRDLDAARAAAREEGAARRWQFGNTVLDERTLELTVAGEAVSLERKTLEVLMHLLEHAGEVVTKDELIEAVWPGRVISESTLTSCVGKLRAALEPDAIKTVHGFGYRLAAEVKVQSGTPVSTPRLDFNCGDKPPQRPLWSLVERLGTGGHGEAWLARHDKTREARVFKFAVEAGALASLKREITLHRVLRESLGARPEFVRVLDWNLEEPPYFIESEYAEAGSLAEWTQAQGGVMSVPLAQRIELVAQMAEALAAAHSVGVLHKDLKPGNVLIDVRSGAPRIQLADFGSGAVLDPQRLEALGITRMGHTRMVDTGSTSGTPLYFAPEVIAGQPFTVQADIYALGVMLYQLAVGDLRRSLAPGWEQDIADEFLRDDIRDAAAGNPARRITDAAQLAQRLRTLEQRRAERARQVAAAEAARSAQVEAEKLARVSKENRRLRRASLAFAVLTMLAIGASGLAYVQRNKALAARDVIVVRQAESAAQHDAPLPGHREKLPMAEVYARFVRYQEALLKNCEGVFLDMDDMARCPDGYVRNARYGLAQVFHGAGRHEDAEKLYAERVAWLDGDPVIEADEREFATPDQRVRLMVLLAQEQAEIGKFDLARATLARAGTYDQVVAVLRGDRTPEQGVIAGETGTLLLARYRRVEGLLARDARDFRLARERLEQSLQGQVSRLEIERIRQELATLPAP